MGWCSTLQNLAVGGCESISMNMETITVKFDLSTSNYAASPDALSFSAVYQNQVLADIASVEGKQTIQFELELEDGDQELQFIMKNKTVEHTQVDDNGNIIADLFLTITDMQIDNVDLEFTFQDNCVYHHDCNGTQDPIEDSFHGTMGCNGTVTFKFAIPFYIWLLENF